MHTGGNKPVLPNDNIIEDANGALIRPVEEDAPSIETRPPSLPARLRSRLPAFHDAGQRRAFGNILRFLALVLVFTLVARGTSAATMPKITTTSPYRGEIAETVSISATVVAAQTRPIHLPEGLKIDQVLVVPGQKVTSGDALFLLDAEKLATLQKREQLKLEEMNLNLQKLQRGEPYDSSALIGAQNTAAWAETDYGSVQSNQAALVAAANDAVTQAAAERDAAQRALDELEADESATEEQRQQARERLSAAQAAVPAAEQRRDEAVRAADTAVTEAARAVESARLALASAQMEDERLRQETADQQAQNALAAEALLLDIEEQTALLETYDKAARDGHVYARVSGTVMEILAAGDTVSEKPAALISDDSGGFRAEGMADKAAAEQLSSGDNAEVSSGRGFFETSAEAGATVLSVDAPGENGLARVLFRLPGGDWKQGQNVTVTVTRSRQEYPLIVPLSAVHQAQSGYYVFIVETRSGVLGLESVILKVAVNIDAKNNEYAAISGALGTEDKVVVSATKPLATGDKVRMGEL